MNGFGWPTLRFIFWAYGLLALVVLINYLFHSVYALVLFPVWYGLTWILALSSVNRHTDKVRFIHEAGEWEYHKK